MIRKHDMLDLCKSKAERGLMKWLTMTNGPHPLQQMISRLLNALASFRKGRRYLASSPFLLRLIVTQLISSQHFWDTITCNMLLGTLQKLSTRFVQITPRYKLYRAGSVVFLILAEGRNPLISL